MSNDDAGGFRLTHKHKGQTGVQGHYCLDISGANNWHSTPALLEGGLQAWTLRDAKGLFDRNITAVDVTLDEKDEALLAEAARAEAQAAEPEKGVKPG